MTPQTQLTVSQYFNDSEVRGIEQDNDIWFINIDLTKAWGVHRNTINNIIDRNPKKFEGFFTTVAHGTCAGLTAVNEKGLYLLMGAMNTDRMKNQDAAVRMLQFQRWIPELIKSFRKGDLVPVLKLPETKQTTFEILKEQLDLADIAIERSDVPKNIAHKIAWATVGTITGNEVATAVASYIKTQTKQASLTEAIPTDVVDYESHYSITKLAGFLKLPVDKVRNVLESLNVIYFENGIWHLTKYGEKFGKMFMVTPGYPYSSRQRAYIKYNPDCVDLLKRYFEGEVKV